VKFELIDLARHTAGCARCNGLSYCSKARAIVSVARTMILTHAEQASWGRPILGRA
jgi:hypothetical protein